MNIFATVCAVAATVGLSFAPPSGRPPIGPLQRVEPKAYDFAFGATISTIQQQNALDKRSYTLKDAPIVMPLVFQGSFSRAAADTVQGQLWYDGHEDRSTQQRMVLDDSLPFHTHLAVLTVPHFTGQSLRWRVNFRTQSWSSRMNEDGAGRLTWPKEWPAEVQDGLKPQQYIESDDPVFAETVDRISEGKLRLVPPYYAAKDIVRYCINEVRVSGDGTDFGGKGVIRGLEIQGALETAREQLGSPHDLLCVCIAMLRAAGIPARPVIGVEEGRDSGACDFVSWGEFYLPDCGWIPFDPNEMRGKGIKQLDVRKAWPEFGTMEDLNDRVVLGYHFIPPKAVETPRNPGVWGWDPRPGKDFGSEVQIHMTMISRGKGEEDPPVTVE